MLIRRMILWLVAMLAIVGCGEESGIPVGRTYNLAWIHGESMRDFTGRGAVIGVWDAMFDLDHPDFARLRLRYNSAQAWDGSYTHRAMHGTHMLGILAAEGVVRGLAPEAEYVLSSSDNVNYAFGEMEDAGVDVASNSFIMADYFGYEYIVETVEDQVLNAYDGRGIVHVFAAGNQGRRIGAGETFPEAFGRYALIVGELDAEDLTLCSNYGSAVDVFVRVPVRTTRPGGGHTIDRGSSSAVPIVAAVVARARRLRPDLNATTIMDLVCKSADRIGGVPYDLEDENGNKRSELYGCGQLNARRFFAAVEAFGRVYKD
jgi:subtilisin family serine protease